MLHIPDDVAKEAEATVEDVCRVARSHGIGVITAGDPTNYATWNEREEALRSEPDPERLDQFISTQLSKQTCDSVAKALW